MISILLPVYNTPSDWLFQCFESIDNQIFKDYEVIVINDASTDNNTLEVINKYKSNPKYKIFNLVKNSGIVKALNYGIKKCQYEYIARMDSDDIMKPNRLEVQYKYMLDNPNVDVSSTDMIFIRQSGNGWFTYEKPNPHPSIVTKEYVQTHDWFLNHPAVMYKKSKVLSVGGYNEEMYGMAEDFELWVRMLKKGMVLHNINEKLLIYRFSDNSLSKKFLPQNQEYIQKIQNSLFDNNIKDIEVNNSIQNNTKENIIAIEDIKEKYLYNEKQIDINESIVNVEKSIDNVEYSIKNVENTIKNIEDYIKNIELIKDKEIYFKNKEIELNNKELLLEKKEIDLKNKENLLKSKYKYLDILLLPDVSGWAFDNIANAIIKYNPYPDKINYTKKYIVDKPHIDYDLWDYVYVMFEAEKSIPINKDKMIRGCYSALWLEYPKFSPKFFGDLFSKCRAAIFVNDNFLNEVSSFLNVDSTIIYDSADETIFYPIKEHKLNEFTVIFVGNTQRVIKYFSDIEKICELANVNLIVAENISHDQLVYEYNKADISINFSLSEGEPQTFIESSLCGVPMLIKDNNVLSKQIPCFTGNSIDDYVKILNHLKNNRQLCSEIGEKARQVALSNFTYKETAKKFADFFLELNKNKLNK